MLVLILAALVLIVVVVSAAWVIDRAHERAHDEREAHRQAIEKLTVRIQHPERIPVEEYPSSSKPHHLPWEDDNAWRSYVEAN
jgi:HAMP domain-containing protein